MEDIPQLRLLSMVVKRCWHLYPSADGMVREASELGGYPIPAERRLGDVLVACTPRSAVFRLPERIHSRAMGQRFREKAAKGVYFPFGLGPQVRIGNSLAHEVKTMPV